MKKIMFTLVLACFALFMSAQSTSMSYFDNGNIMTTYYMHGNYAERLSYYENGIVKEYATFLDGKPHGSWKLYNEKGKLVSNGTYQNGMKSGVWKVWSNDAATMVEVTYHNNEVIHSQEWATGKR